LLARAGLDDPDVRIGIIKNRDNEDE